MTANQIAYRKAIEEERAHKRNEEIAAHEADTKRMAHQWNKEYQTHKLFLDTAGAATNFLGATTQGFKNFASGTKDLMQGASSSSGLFS